MNVLLKRTLSVCLLLFLAFCSTKKSRVDDVPKTEYDAFIKGKVKILRQNVKAEAKFAPTPNTSTTYNSTTTDALWNQGFTLPNVLSLKDSPQYYTYIKNQTGINKSVKPELKFFSQTSGGAIIAVSDVNLLTGGTVPLVKSISEENFEFLGGIFQSKGFEILQPLLSFKKTDGKEYYVSFPPVKLLAGPAAP